MISSKNSLKLDDFGVETIIDAAQKSFRGEKPDVLVIDPLRNVFFSPHQGENNENDNAGMISFIRDRVFKIRDDINPNTGVIIAHHLCKLNTSKLSEPFESFAGAGSLRGIYSTGVLTSSPS